MIRFHINWMRTVLGTIAKMKNEMEQTIKNKPKFSLLQYVIYTGNAAKLRGQLYFVKGYRPEYDEYIVQKAIFPIDYEEFVISASQLCRAPKSVVEEFNDRYPIEVR